MTSDHLTPEELRKATGKARATSATSLHRHSPDFGRVTLQPVRDFSKFSTDSPAFCKKASSLCE